MTSRERGNPTSAFRGIKTNLEGTANEAAPTAMFAETFPPLVVSQRYAFQLALGTAMAALFIR